jgi:hypothetical protein
MQRTWQKLRIANLTHPAVFIPSSATLLVILPQIGNYRMLEDHGYTDAILIIISIHLTQRLWERIASYSYNYCM